LRWQRLKNLHELTKKKGGGWNKKKIVDKVQACSEQMTVYTFLTVARCNGLLGPTRRHMALNFVTLGSMLDTVIQTEVSQNKL